MCSNVLHFNSTRACFYDYEPRRQEHLMDVIPKLKSPLTATDVVYKSDNPSPLSDLLIPLFSGPGKDEERLIFAKKYLESGQESDRHNCALVEDSRNHTSAFYASAQLRKEMLQFLLEHEKNW